MARPGLEVFGVPSVDSRPRDGRRNAEVFPVLETKLALPAGRVDPTNPDPVADGVLDRLGALLNDSADNLVAEDQREFHGFRQLRPVSLRQMQVRMTHTAGFHADQHLIRAWNGHGHLLYLERPLEFPEDRRFHLFSDFSKKFFALFAPFASLRLVLGQSLPRRR